MSKFDDLCAAFAEGRSKAIAERDATWNFAAMFVGGFKSYLEYPDRFQFTPVVSKPKLGPGFYSLQGALELGEDGFWHIGVTITVYAAKNQFSQFHGLIHLSFKQSGSEFIVKPSPIAPEIKIQGKNASDLEPAYEAAL